MSTSNAQRSVAKTRPYRLGKRADRQQETRLRIVQAAIELHSSIGPARTTVARIAERAGVQRHTYYAHFPEERDLMMACSGLSLERDPLPDPEAWLALPKGRDRLRQGLGELYGWFARNESMAACVLRDVEVHQPTREIVDLRMRPTFERVSEVLAEGLNASAKALLHVALDFSCWRALRSADQGADPAEIMSGAIAALY